MGKAKCCGTEGKTNEVDLMLVNKLLAKPAGGLGWIGI